MPSNTKNALKHGAKGVPALPERGDRRLAACYRSGHKAALVQEGHMPVTIRRRELIATLGGAAVSWPLGARAQQGARMRRIGVFMPGASDDPEGQARIGAFLQGLGELGWIIGRNVRIDYRWGGGDLERYNVIAAELIALSPDVILALGYSIVSALQKATRSVPIVFASVTDPVGGGLVASLARPGGNTTGFVTSEFGFAGKWLELLKEIAPRVTRAAVMRDSAIASQIALFGSIQSVAPSLGVDCARSVRATPARSSAPSLLSPANRTAALDRSIRRWMIKHRELIVTLAARHRLPASTPTAATS